MAVQVRFLRAKSLDDLEEAINALIGADNRTEVDLEGPPVIIDGEYVQAIKRTSIHRRTFDDPPSPS